MLTGGSIVTVSIFRTLTVVCGVVPSTAGTVSCAFAGSSKMTISLTVEASGWAANKFGCRTKVKVNGHMIFDACISSVCISEIEDERGVCFRAGRGWLRDKLCMLES